MNTILLSIALALPGGNGPGVIPTHSKAVLERAFAWERTFLANLQQCIATGDAAHLTTLTRPDSLCLLYWHDEELFWAPDCSGTVDEFEEQLPQMFDIRCAHPRFTRWREGDYAFLVQEWGGFMIKLTIHYDKDPRIDHVVVTTDAAGRIKAFSMHRDVAGNPYYDYDLERLVTE